MMGRDQAHHLGRYLEDATIQAQLCVKGDL